MRAQNEFGGYSITDYEYIYMIKEDGIHDALVDLKVNPKIIMLAARAFNVASKKDKNADFTSSIKPEFWISNFPSIEDNSRKTLLWRTSRSPLPYVYV